MKYIFVFITLFISASIANAHELSKGQTLTTNLAEISQLETYDLRVSLTPDYEKNTSSINIIDKINNKENIIVLSPYFKFERTTVEQADTINICHNIGYYVVLSTYFAGQEAYLLEREQGNYQSLLLFNSSLTLIGQIDDSTYQNLDVYYLVEAGVIDCFSEEVNLN